MDTITINHNAKLGDGENIEILYKSDREKSVRRYDKIHVYGRDGYYSNNEDGYEGYEGRLHILTKTPEGEQRLAEKLGSHLGEFTIQLNDGPLHERGRIKRHTTEVLQEGLTLHQIEIDYQPFLYTKLNVFKRPTETITNPSPVEARPIIKLVGSGEVQATIGSQTFVINATRGVIINSETMRIVDLSGLYNQRSFIAVKDFMTIPSGTHAVNILGADEWEIRVQWRYE